ncbi:MAG TPA: ABC transporter, partial [Bacteroidia bacterium]|nr:ABC transporter [Bacteroidia bacterium]
MNSLKHINKYFYKYRWYLLLGILFVAVSNIFGVYSFLYVGDAMDFVDEISNLKDTEAAYKQLLYYGGLVIGLAIVSGFFLFLICQFR